MAEFSGTPDGHGRRFVVLASRFNENVTQKLVDGALDALVRHGAAVDDVDVVWVPGAWELPVAARRLLGSERYDAIVAVGAVVRGGTPHFEYVAGECAAGIMRVALDTGVPCAFGILTTDDLAQALARAGGSEGNKGAEAACTAIEMATLLRRLPHPRTGG